MQNILTRLDQKMTNLEDDQFKLKRKVLTKKLKKDKNFSNKNKTQMDWNISDYIMEMKIE